MIIEGTVAPGFESVKTLYEKNMYRWAERNTQLCVYVGDECVVDLWGSTTHDPNFSADSLINVFSSGKSLEAITLAMLVERGLVSYDSAIADYWPEYGQNGKASTTVADLMRHEAGLASFDVTIAAEDLWPEALKRNAIGRVIESQTPLFRPGIDQQREYHAVTRGWIVNELFRRVEPNGRTMGEFLREEISQQLGADVYIGLQDEELSRVNPVHLLGPGYQLGQSVIPNFLGRRMELNLAQMLAKIWRLRGAMTNRTRSRPPTPISGMNQLGAFNSAAYCKGETPSAGAKCSARGLAKLAAVMANGGSLGDVQIMQAETHTALHGAPVPRSMIAMETTFTQGGVATFRPTNMGDAPLLRGLNAGREGFYGWMGLGGSIFQWHPEKKIGFGYAPTSLNVLDVVNERGKAYQAEVVRCLA